MWAAMLERMRRSGSVSSFTGADDSRAACAAGCESSGVQRVFVAKLTQRGENDGVFACLVRLVHPGTKAAMHQRGTVTTGRTSNTGVDDDKRQGLRAEGLDPDDPAVIAVIDVVRWELSLGT